MFRGATKLNLDDKGRMVMPTRHREWLRENSENRVVITVDRDHCLLIYPILEWDRVERQLMALPTFHPETRRLQRLIVGHATDLQLDGHGRVQLTPELRQFAALQRQVMLVGQGSRFELWDEARWLEQRESWLKGEESGGSLPAELGSLSL
jgi:MraZ protein